MQVEYGELNPYQKLVVDGNINKINQAKESIDSSLSRVKVVEEECTLLEENISKIGSASFISDRSGNFYESKIWETTKAALKNMDVEKSEIERELKILEKYAGDCETKISSEIKNLEDLSGKVESFKNDSGWGVLNWMFGQTTTNRVRDSSLKAEGAELKCDQVNAQVKAITTRRDILNKEINDLFIGQMELKTNFNRRVGLAQNLGSEIATAREQYNLLLQKYEDRQETFLKYKVPAKIKNEDRADILRSLDQLKTQIGSLEALEKRVTGDKVVLGESEAHLFNSVTEALEQSKISLEAEASNTKDLIANTVSEPMGTMDKMWNSVGKMFSYSKERKVEGPSELEQKIAQQLRDEDLIEKK